MASKYGMPWCGSKSTIAEWIIGLLPAAETFVDLFAGGCAITHCAMLSGKYERYICNDISGSVDVFIRAINGEFKDYDYVPTREEFFNSDDLAVKMLYSFGNNCKDYLWSKELEPVKYHASRMISAPTIHERNAEYRKFIKALEEFMENERIEGLDKVYGLWQISSLKRLESLECLTRLERLKSLECLTRLERLKSLECLTRDYQTVTIPGNSVIYCDPPYKTAQKTTKYGAIAGEFDYERFEDWLNNVDFPVFVSEENAPEGCVPIGWKDKARYISAKKTYHINEGLFLQERFLPWYEQLRSKKEAV